MNPKNKPPSDQLGIRPGKLLSFFKEAAKQLNEEGKEDEAFYFEQIVDYLQDGKDLTDDPRKVALILGL